jgi:hypothetical protein
MIGARRDAQEKTVKAFSSLAKVSGGAGTKVEETLARSR